MKTIALLCLLSASVFGQSPSTGSAATKGACSPANTGNKNTFNIKCGIGKEQGDQILKVLNKIVADRLDPDAVMAMLDKMRVDVAAVRSQTPVTTGRLQLIYPPPLNSTSGGDGAVIIEIGPGGPALELGHNNYASFIKFKNEEDPLEVRRDSNGKLLVTTTIRDINGNLIARMIDNEWHTAGEHSFDSNHNDDALEIQDDHGDIVLQVKLLANNHLWLQGRWRSRTGAGFALGSQGCIEIQPAPKGPLNRCPPIEPLFKYPSSLHPEELK